jgi:hypothetical protein
MFGVAVREKQRSTQAKLRGDGTVVRRCIWLANTGPLSKLMWGQNQRTILLPR